MYLTIQSLLQPHSVTYGATGVLLKSAKPNSFLIWSIHFGCKTPSKYQSFKYKHSKYVFNCFFFQSIKAHILLQLFKKLKQTGLPIEASFPERVLFTIYQCTFRLCAITRNVMMRSVFSSARVASVCVCAACLFWLYVYDINIYIYIFGALWKRVFFC